MMKTKRIISMTCLLAVCAALLLSLTGCGAKTDSAKALVEQILNQPAAGVTAEGTEAAALVEGYCSGETAITSAATYLTDYFVKTTEAKGTTLVKKVTFTEAGGTPVKVEFVAEVDYTTSTGTVEATQAKGFVYVEKDGKVSTINLGGELLHLLKKGAI